MLRVLIRQVSWKLLLYGLAVAVGASLVLAPLMPLIFGHQWAPTRWIIPILIPLFVGQLVISPLSMAFVASQANKNEMLAQSCLAIIRLLPVYAGASLGLSFNHVLMGYSFACAIGYGVYGIILWVSVSSVEN